MALSAGKLDAAFADDRVIPLRKRFRKFIHPRNAASSFHFFFACLGPRENHILADGSIEQKCLLEDHSELGPVAAETHRREIDAIHENPSRRGRVKRRDQADYRRFSGAGGAH